MAKPPRLPRSNALPRWNRRAFAGLCGCLATVPVLNRGVVSRPPAVAAMLPPAPPVSVANASPAPMVNPATPGAESQSRLTPGRFVPLTIAISNTGTEPDRLLGGDTPVARAVLPCDARDDWPTPLPEGIELPAGAFRVLEPGSETLVLIELTQGLVQGQTVDLTLHFARVGPVAIVARVRRKQDAAGVPLLPAVSAGMITVLHVSLPPAPVYRDPTTPRTSSTPAP